MAARLKRAPKGYYGPRIAVGLSTMVGSVALYELVSEAIRRVMAPPPRDYGLWDGNWDEGPPEPQAAGQGEEAAPAAVALELARQMREAGDSQVERRHLLFVRHAQPADSPGASEQKKGAVADPLSAVGRRQAEVTGKRLCALFGEDISAIHHAGSPEARATAEALGKSLNEGREAKSRLQVAESALLAEGFPVVPSPAPKGLGEVEEAELALDAARAEGAFRAHVWCPAGGPETEGLISAEVIVGHGNLIRFLACRALQLPETAWSRLAASHCTITWLDIGADGTVSLHEFGGSGHLPPELFSYF